ncbi:3323_t:CDS:2 [Ambispora gerdemannii]|uniref:3323_t:CDS:1 n=1 Tax=Ambispora gerdemannii TaxID=144530 RepID=A0A9N9G3K1_9GLOM|nr:3323_t:CDS:2 [Ambispora gerdemannii]
MRLHFHMLGVNTIGSFIAHHLRRVEHKVTLLLRDTAEQAILKRRGYSIKLEDEEGVINVASMLNSESMENLEMGDAINPKFLRGPQLIENRIRSLIVTITPYKVGRNIARLFYRMGPETTIVLLTNGMGVYEELVKGFFVDESTRPNLLLARTTHEVFQRGSFDVKLVKQGEIYFASPDNNPLTNQVLLEAKRKKLKIKVKKENQDRIDYKPILEEILRTSYIDPSYIKAHPEIVNLIRAKSMESTIRALSVIPELQIEYVSYQELQEMLFEKQMVDCVVQPLTTIYAITNNGLVNNPPANRVIDAICMENSVIMDRHSVELGLRPSSRWRKRRIMEQVEQRCQKVPLHWSTMLHNIRDRGITDVEYVNGYMVRLGVKYGIPTPVNSLMVDMVKMKHRLLAAPNVYRIKEKGIRQRTPNEFSDHKKRTPDQAMLRDPPLDEY